MLIYRRLERLANSDDIVLDIGTKDGQYLEKIPGTVIGLDLEFKFPLSSECPSYLYADGRVLPLKTNSVDYIIMNQVLEHVDDKQSLVSEVARVIKPDGVALFSFPNRISLSRPHGLPRWLSILPKPIGLQIANLLLSREDLEYYRDGVFPFSPIRARRLFSEYFEQVKYITIDESVKSSDIYSDSFAPQLFVSFLPLIAKLAVFQPFAWAFETIWSYAGYECTAVLPSNR